MNNILSIRDIVKQYDMDDEDPGVLKHIEFLMDEVEFITLHDSSESGKQPMMTIIGCLDVPDYEQREPVQMQVASTSLTQRKVLKRVSA